MAKCKILLVDDDIEDYMIMKEAFHDLGADESLMYVRSGMEALQFMGDQYETDQTVPHIVVLDINMPVMNGPAVLKAMRQDPRFGKITVVIYSTAINPTDEKQCQDLGAVYCFTKPGKLEEIIKVGEKLLELCEEESGKHS